MPRKISRRELINTSSAVGIAAMASQVRADEASEDEPNPLLTVRPRTEDKKPWLMPAHFGSPEWRRPPQVADGDLVYGDVTRISIDYRTEEKALLRLLPHPYELNGSPIVTVTYSMNRGISWLAGGDYNIISVSMRATYPGKVDRVSGSYMLVLWENLTEPILTGREIQGLPKIYGEIENHRVFDGVWRTSLSDNGKTILEMQAADLTKMAPDDLKLVNERSQQVTALGWKYIPDETTSNAVVSYATLFPMSFHFREAWSAKGSLQWHPRKWEESPTQAHIVNALHALPAQEIVSSTVSKGSSLLHKDRARRLV